MTEVAAIILAAGRASRFGSAPGDSKVLADLDGKPLIQHTAAAVLSSRARPIVVVTGASRERLAAALDGADVVMIHNPDAATGMASSLKTGLVSLPASAAGVVIALADMPLVSSATIDALIEAFSTAKRQLDAVLPSYQGRAGNPVLIGRALFADLKQLEGDAGARTLLREPGRRVLTIPVDDPGILVDVDTPAALRALADDREP